MCFFFLENSNLRFDEFFQIELISNIKILSFEPNVEAYSKFSKTLKKNLNLSKKIKLENFGLSDKSAKLKMQSMLKFGYAQTGGSSVIDENLNDKARKYIKENGLKLEKIMGKKNLK